MGCGSKRCVLGWVKSVGLRLGLSAFPAVAGGCGALQLQRDALAATGASCVGVGTDQTASRSVDVAAGRE